MKRCMDCKQPTIDNADRCLACARRRFGERKTPTQTDSQSRYVDYGRPNDEYRKLKDDAEESTWEKL